MAEGTFHYFFKFNLLTVTYLFSLLIKNSNQDILGCGGFLKSSVSIDFSKVEVKLFTKQGTLKESSDCAPTNGYYFIPIYDKGEYLLKIKPPDEWHFEPKEVHLNFNGASDPCSKSRDINFQFKGFSISGKVISIGSSDGPENVVVNLLSESGTSSKLSSITREKGVFRFMPVLPGKYVIRAEHEKLKFLKDFERITINEENLKVPIGSLIVAGYDITGQVLFNNEPTMGVGFFLYANDERNRHVKVEGCSDSPLVNPNHKDHICYVLSDEEGTFLYKTVPPGNYSVRPHYAKFGVQPGEISVLVKHEHVALSDKFLVRGFSVSGRIVASSEGSGLKDVEIYLNNERVAVSDKEGKFTLNSMVPGEHTLSMRAENLKFNDVTVKLSPNTPEIEKIYPAEFKVCGLVTSASVQPLRVVRIEPANHSEKLTEASVDHDTGKFCVFLKPGLYKLAVKISDLEKSMGMQYLPLVRDVHVKSSPISDIEFTQLRGNIYGRVVKLPESTKAIELSVKLKLKNSLVALKILEGNDLSYSFNDVMPGYYDVEVENNLWCFQNQVHSISVKSSETTVPDFFQTGFKVKIKSSHNTFAIITNSNAPGGEFKRELSLERGDNLNCFPHSTVYKLQPMGCHGYDEDFYMIDPKQGTTLNLQATSHDVTGSVKSPYLYSDLEVMVVLPKGQIQRLGPLKGEKDSDGYRYRFTYRSKENEILKFIPRSNKLLFRPEMIEFRTMRDCSEDAIQFSGEKGLIVEGRINPPLSNVKVTLKIKDEYPASEGLTFFTQSDGKYKFGPLRSSSSFEITAEKESYILKGPDERGVFNAHKLAEIEVKVIDNATNEPLQGVLLSLTGGEKYRRNSMTEEGGLLNFHSLSPGEYFLRPMMKEYKFEPSSQIIQIKEGVTESVELRGRRVSFSAYGSVTSLNGEPEPNVIIEAFGLNACSNLQEEAPSESNGQFRIRGLLPQCEYQIRLKSGPDVNALIHRLEPPDLIVKASKGDIWDIQLIAFHLMENMDISVHVESTIPEHLKTLKLKLCKDNEPDSPIHVVKLDSVAGGVKFWGHSSNQERFLKAGLLVQLPFIPRDKTPYFIQIESSLNKHTYSYKEPTVHFIADKTFRNFKLTFDPSLKTLDHEFSQSSYIVVPLLILAGLIYTYFNKAVPVVQNFFGSLNQTTFSFNRDDRNFYSHNSVMDNMSIEPVVMTSAKRRPKPRKA